MTDPLGQSQVLPYLEGLSKKGYQFTLISCEKRKRYEVHKKAIQDLCGHANIHWVPLIYSKNPPVLSTIYDVIKMRQTAFGLHQKNNYAIVHCRSYLSALIGLEMKKKFGIRFIFDMRGFWADERIDGRLWDLKNPVYNQVYRFFKRKERDFIVAADYIISLTQNAKDEILSWKIPRQALPIQVIPCCADLDLFSYEAISKIKLEEEKKNLGLVRKILC